MNRLFLYFILFLAAFSLNAQVSSGITESSEPLGDRFLDDIVTRSFFEAHVMPYPPLREADVPWSKRMWRVIETREKINIPFRSPHRPFFEILLDGILTSEITAFKNETFEDAFTIEEIRNELFRTDSVMFYDPETYEQTIRIVQNDINPDDIVRYRIKEIWYFDKNASRLKVRILGISPLHQTIDVTTGELRYEIPLFWVYYPEIRSILGRERVMSDYNDAFPMSWYDLMENRMFSSYIMKSSNILDERLMDRFEKSLNVEMDVLLESERLKQELFNLEQDLWSY